MISIREVTADLLPVRVSRRGDHSGELRLKYRGSVRTSEAVLNSQISKVDASEE